MDFGAFPPDFNSARMYAGAGAAPLLAAASAWQALAAELSSVTASYQSVVNGLTSEGWMGPASASMAAAAAPYITWMASTAARAEQAANQANAAAAAYEAAFTMTVPPPAIAANRVQLAALVATNILGQNMPLIAACEALYGEFWAQDAAAMYGYAGDSAAAAKVTPFTSPPPTTDPTGSVAQSAAATQGAGNSVAANAQTALSQFTSSVPPTLQGMASPLDAAPTGPVLDYTPTISGGDMANAMTNLASSTFSPMGLAGISQFGADLAVIRGAAMVASDPLGLGALDGLATGLPGAGAATLGSAGMHGPWSGAGAISAGIGRATSVGAISVPQSWAAAAPEVSSGATPFATASWTSAVPHAEAAGAPGMPGMPLAGSGNRAFGFATPRYGFKPTVVPKPVVAG